MPSEVLICNSALDLLIPTTNKELQKRANAAFTPLRMAKTTIISVMPELEGNKELTRLIEDDIEPAINEGFLAVGLPEKAAVIIQMGLEKYAAEDIEPVQSIYCSELVEQIEHNLVLNGKITVASLN